MSLELWVAERFKSRLSSCKLTRSVGHVIQVTGLLIESDGPCVGMGEICEIETAGGHSPLFAEVVGFRGHRLLLMPLSEIGEIRSGSRVCSNGRPLGVPVGEAMIGRVIDGLARPIDGKGALDHCETRPMNGSPPNPLLRRRINIPLVTGVRAIDVFTPVGCGQRMGIFSGSGVGKSSLMGMMARGAESDVNVIALVGERGRELRDFIEKDLGPAGLRRSVIVVATSDQPALVRMRAAFCATAIAEYFRDSGKKVLFMMDSVTRFAMAQREVGLAVGEPPSSRGYTPSVFSLLPRLLERTGSSDKGSITAFYTVLVEGDDMNEPIADAVRGILDGHLILARSLATANHFPAIDVLESVSRLNRELCNESQLELSGRARDLLATYRKNEDLITIGAYARGHNPKLDQAVEKHEVLCEFLRQPMMEVSGIEQSWETIRSIMS